MKDLKITKAPTIVVKNYDKDNNVTSIRVLAEFKAGHELLCTVNHKLDYSIFKDKTDEALGNARLFAESINVANECGLTPRELLEQRNELRQMLTFLKDEVIKMVNIGSDKEYLTMFRLVQDSIRLIAKTQ